MKTTIKDLLLKIRRDSTCRPAPVVTRAMGRQRYFRAYDRGADTFVFERGVWTGLDEHASVLMIEKGDLRHGAHGHVITVTTGNHSVAALPLLSGLFWDLAKIPQARRGDVMMHAVLCGNVVNGKLEISQRDVPCRKLTAIDDWLTQALGFPLGSVVMVERNDLTLDHYRALGQEWRVKPLAWTETEMKVALGASRKRISTALRYYHAVKGVHFLTYPDFHAFALKAETDWPEFCAELRELVSVFEGHDTSFTRQPKYHGHHEVELFGLSRGVALERLIPSLELLMEGIVLNRIPQVVGMHRILEVDALYKSLLTRPSLADATARDFIATLYMHLTGEIYSVVGEGTTPAFDDRRTALPGATFVNGRPVFHPDCDARSEVLLSNIRALVSKDEHVEYANVYELRNELADGENGGGIGKGSTREIVYKTNRSPLVRSLVEKRLSRPGRDYGSYVISRVEVFKSLGVALPEYRLLRRRAGERRHPIDFFIRTRCNGEPLADLPATYFQMAGEFGGREAGEDAQVVVQLAFLMGDAAAQNLVMKKYDARRNSPLYDVGKEIYSFDYDIKAGRLMPRAVACCSMRGTFGWPDLSFTDANLDRIATFYMDAYAAALRRFAAAHPVVPEAELARRFFDGFEFRSRAVEWQFTVRRDLFENFDPHLPGRYGFLPKWRFVLWSLERQVRRMDDFRAAFFANFGERRTRTFTPVSIDTRVFDEPDWDIQLEF
ncbi:MAG: hypothetical protein MJ240_08620 [Kiritimatiellae bacterium]|nr:hypothetical protein [Kiritimatiellia bacterium]